MDILVFIVCFLINSVIADWLMSFDFSNLWRYGLLGVFFMLLPVGPIGGTILATCMYGYIREDRSTRSFYKAAVYAGFVYFLILPITSIVLYALYGVHETEVLGHSRILSWLTRNNAWIEEGVPVVANGSRTANGYLLSFSYYVFYFLTFIVAAVVARNFRRSGNRANS
jgi:hypothetical protein